MLPIAGERTIRRESSGRGDDARQSRARPPGRLTMILRLLLALGVALALVGAELAISASHQPARHEPVVIDGDTLDLDGRTVQLYGIDAPELGQLCNSDGSLWPCGVEAALALRKLVTFAGHQLACSAWTNDPDAHHRRWRRARALHDRPRGRRAGDAARRSRRRPARQLPGLSGGAGAGPPRRRLGIWHSDFAPPWEWRDETAGEPTGRATSKARATPRGTGSTTCRPIPTIATSSSLRSTEGRLFCSDEEARAAGWSRPTGGAG